MKTFEKFRKFEIDGSQINGGDTPDCIPDNCASMCDSIDNSDVQVNCWKFCMAHNRSSPSNIGLTSA